MGRAHKLFDGFFLPKEYSSPPPKKRKEKKKKKLVELGVLHIFTSEKFHPLALKLAFLHLIRLKMDQKGPKVVFLDQKYLFFFGLFGGYPSHFYLFHFTICKYCCVVIISVPVSLHITIIDNIQGLIKTIHSRLLL